MFAWGIEKMKTASRATQRNKEGKRRAGSDSINDYILICVGRLKASMFQGGFFLTSGAG